MLKNSTDTIASEWESDPDLSEATCAAGILDIHALTRRFGKFTAVNEVSLSVQPGEVFGLLGPNGAGKSTLIKMLTTLLPPTAGTATLAGYSIAKQAKSVRQLIGYVPQALSADGSLTGYENLLIFAKLYDIPRAQRAARIRDVLAFMRLEEFQDRLVRNYSGGMIRRLEVAQSILHHPKLLFLDEPTVGLDPRARTDVWATIERLRQEYGTTIVLTTHFLEEADRLCHRVAIMNQGRTIAIDTPTALKASLDRVDATLDDVFLHYTGDRVPSGVSYHEVSRVRRTASRLG